MFSLFVYTKNKKKNKKSLEDFFIVFLNIKNKDYRNKILCVCVCVCVCVYYNNLYIIIM